MDVYYLMVFFGIILIGLVTSYTDLKYGIIYNKVLAFGLLVSLIVFLLRIFLDSVDFVFVGVNFFIAAAIAVFFWIFGLWTAGDGKLYITYSLLLSLLGKPESFSLYPFFILLVFAFVPYFVYLSSYVLFKSGIENIRRKIFEGLTFKKAFKAIIFSVLNLVAIQWVFEFLPEWEPLVLLRFPLIIGVFFLIERYFKFKGMQPFALVGVARFYFDTRIYSIEFFLKILLMLLLIFFIRKVIPGLGYYIFTKEKNISQLKVGDVPAEIIYKVVDSENRESIVKKEVPFFGFSTYGIEKDKMFFDLKGKGFNSSEIKKIKKLLKEPWFWHKNLRVYQGQSFAHFLFLGSLLFIFLIILN